MQVEHWKTDAAIQRGHGCLLSSPQEFFRIINTWRVLITDGKILASYDWDHLFRLRKVLKQEQVGGNWRAPVPRQVVQVLVRHGKERPVQWVTCSGTQNTGLKWRVLLSHWRQEHFLCATTASRTHQDYCTGSTIRDINSRGAQPYA